MIIHYLCFFNFTTFISPNSLSCETCILLIFDNSSKLKNAVTISTFDLFLGLNNLLNMNEGFFHNSFNISFILLFIVTFSLTANLLIFSACKFFFCLSLVMNSLYSSGIKSGLYSFSSLFFGHSIFSGNL